MSGWRALRIALLLSLLLLLAGVWLLLGPGGARLALGMAEHYSHGTLRVGQVSGSLFGTLIVEDIRVREHADGPLLLQVARARLHWLPWQLLLRHRLEIAQLRLERPQLWLDALGPSGNQRPSARGPVQVPAPPLPLRLDRLVIVDLQLHRRAGPAIGPLQFKLSAHTDRQALHIERLALLAPQGRLRLSGQMRFGAGLPFRAELQWRGRLANGLQLAGGGRLQGNSDGLGFEQTTRLPGRVALSGRVSWTQAAPAFDLKAEWPRLTWQAPGRPALQASGGHLHVSGTPLAYRIELRSQLALPGAPPLGLAARAHGNGHALLLDQLTLQTLGGRIEGSGQLTWAPGLSGQFRLNGRGLQPQRQWPAWPGRLGFAAAATFTQGAGGPSARYRLDALDGTLRGQKIDAKASLSQAGAHVTLDRLVLQVGKDRLQGRGSLSPRLDLSADLKAPRLRPWLPGSKASLVARALLNGTPQRPRVKLHARVSALGERHGPPLQLDLDADLKATLAGTGQTLDGRLGLSIPGQAANRLQAAIALQAAPNQPGLAQATVQGWLRGQLRLERVLASLAPELPGVNSRIDADLHLGGHLDRPTYRGHLALEEQRLLVPPAGITLQDLRLRLSANGGADLALTGSAHSGSGTLALQGRIQPSGPQGAALRLAVTGHAFKIADLPEARVWITPDLTLDASARDGVQVHGKVLVPRAHLAPPQLAASAVSPSDDVVVASPKGVPPTRPYAGRIDADLQLQIGYPNRTLPQSCLDPNIPTPADCPGLSFNGYGLKALMAGDLRLQQHGDGEPQVNGQLKVLGGQFAGYGSNLQLQPGELLFTGPADNPRLNLSAQRAVDQVTAGLRIGGTLKQPQTTLYSDPPMDHSEILSYLLFGHSLEAGGSASGSNSMLRSAGYSLAGNLLGRALAKPLGIDLSFASNSAGNQGLTLGKYLSPRFYVGYGLDLFDHSVVLKVVYQLSRHLSVQARGGQASGLDLEYRTQWN